MNMHTTSVIEGHKWSNTSISEPMQSLLGETKCCVTHYDTAHYENGSTCKSYKTQYMTFFVLTLILSIILVVIAIENFHYGLNRGRLSKITTGRILSFTDPDVYCTSFCCDSPLVCTAIDYCSLWAVIPTILVPVAMLAMVITGSVLLSGTVGAYHHTTAYLQNCTTTTSQSQGNLTYGVQCLGDFYLPPIRANVTWKFTTAQFFSEDLAASLSVNYNNTQKNVIYFSNYQKSSNSNPHYHTLFDETNGNEIFQVHQQYMVGLLLLAIGVTFGFALFGIREVWRRKLKRDYLADQNRPNETQPLVSPAAAINSPNRSQEISQTPPTKSSTQYQNSKTLEQSTGQKQPTKVITKEEQLTRGPHYVRARRKPEFRYSTLPLRGCRLSVRGWRFHVRLFHGPITPRRMILPGTGHHPCPAKFPTTLRLLYFPLRQNGRFAKRKIFL
eukprot:Phypoly_transcript_05330.p1 GENE.Phypoly_transcript_05330~~Phypoly_transcript_05330.p1  ORF type:complete len:503 (+),score=33.52 Phypoly_transcript_05330:182-1510(+)